MKRRASSEIFGIIAIGAVLTIAMGITMESSADLVYGGKVTVRDAVNDYQGRISELVQVVSTSNDPASVQVINYGSSPITIDQVRIDSVNASYTIYEYDSQGRIQKIYDAIMPVKKLVRVDASNGANTMQILTSNTNVIDIDLP
ncbi:MAG: hypothetical protein K8823_173 [Cenarchaeum symbiont of Oopsacas minuta]|nr:hypothetical protein [Cenarchaeum symbiont of Oopsacas minuta]